MVDEGAIRGGFAYRLHANRKTIEGTRHANRNALFEHINARVRAALRRGDPTVPVDTKKEVVLFMNGGREWGPQGQ